MTRLGNINRNMGGGGNGGRVGERRETVSLKDLPEEEQRAWELVDALKKVNEPELLRKLLERTDATDPPSAGGLKNIAAHYDNLGMPLSSAGVARFKAERTLVGGTMTGAIARAYVRALDGREILVLVSKAEESTLRPSEKACLTFLRELGKKSDASVLKPIKEHLGLNNPQLSDDAADLENEYVGAVTVKEISKVTSLRRTPLTREGLRDLGVTLALEAAQPAKVKK